MAPACMQSSNVLDAPLKIGYSILLSVNYEYWLPVPKMMFAGARELMAAYQSRASNEGVDALGYYMAPLAYAQLQVVEQAINATQSLADERLASTRTPASVDVDNEAGSKR